VPAHQGRRLIDAAHQFEASLMQELLAPLTRDPLSGSDATGDGQDEDEGSMQALSGFAGSSMARAISEHGGFGIARLLLDRLGPEGPRRP